jgi:hypothetical protein
VSVWFDWYFPDPVGAEHTFSWASISTSFLKKCLFKPLACF